MRLVLVQGDSRVVKSMCEIVLALIRPPVEFLFFGGVARIVKPRRCRLYYYRRHLNFGDRLNLALFKYFGVDVAYAAPSYAHVVAIGSLLQQLLPRPGKRTVRTPIHVFGTGLLMPLDRTRLIRPIVVHAVRGRLSRMACEKVIGDGLQGIVVGDPGLMIRRIFPWALSEAKKYDVAIVRHLYEDESESASKISLGELKVRYVSVRDGVESFVRQIAQSRFVLSSALHGLVCADSLGIPNRRIILSGKLEADELKFEDYYSAFFAGGGHPPLDLRHCVITSEDVKRLVAESHDRVAEVERICDELTDSFLRMREQLRRAGIA